MLETRKARRQKRTAPTKRKVLPLNKKSKKTRKAILFLAVLQILLVMGRKKNIGL